MKSFAAKESVIDFTKKWWLSVLLIFPIWLVIHQFYLSLARNILNAVNYNYPPVFDILFFILDTVTLLIHEAGHTLFGVFGLEFLAILGGTLLQLLIPFLLFISGWFNSQKVLIQCSLFWLGFSWMDTAAYCADAKFRDLPLIGNLPKSAHDFYNMLTQLGALENYRTIAWLLFLIGLICLLLSLLWPVIKHRKTDLADLSNQLEKAGLDI